MTYARMQGFASSLAAASQFIGQLSSKWRIMWTSRPPFSWAPLDKSQWRNQEVRPRTLFVCRLAPISPVWLRCLSRWATYVLATRSCAVIIRCSACDRSGSYCEDSSVRERTIDYRRTTTIIHTAPHVNSPVLLFPSGRCSGVERLLGT